VQHDIEVSLLLAEAFHVDDLERRFVPILEIGTNYAQEMAHPSELRSLSRTAAGWFIPQSRCLRWAAKLVKPKSMSNEVHLAVGTYNTFEEAMESFPETCPTPSGS
jgi:hypothetical protein